MKPNQKKEMPVSYIHKSLVEMCGYSSIYIPEFTWDNLRIDSIIIDINHKWVKGFEIKVRKQDFNRDSKWTGYSQFCSSLSIVCPADLIQPDEIESPFGLLWIRERKPSNEWRATPNYEWKKKAKNFQTKNSLAWVYTYTRVLELEIRRLNSECERLREDKQLRVK